jgi:hypothetical protein
VLFGTFAGVSGTAHAANPFPGAYRGTISTNCGQGSFALLAYPDGRLIFLGELVSGGGNVGHRANAVVQADGSFQIAGFFSGNVAVGGVLTTAGVTGQVLGPACSGVLSGAKTSAEGDLLELGGYYTGSTEGTINFIYCSDGSVLLLCPIHLIVGELVATYRGNLFAIIAAGGHSYLVFERTNLTVVSTTTPISNSLSVENTADNFLIQHFFGDYGIDCRSPGQIVHSGFFPVGCSFGSGGFVSGGLNAETFTLSGTLALSTSIFGPSGSYQINRAAPLPNNAPIAVADAYTFVGSLQRTVDADVGVLANDSDLEGDLLTAVLDTGPTHGELTLRSDGSFDYKPNRRFAGTDEFFYLAADGFSESAPVTVTITVEPVKAMPWLGLLLDD